MALQCSLVFFLANPNFSIIYTFFFLMLALLNATKGNVTNGFVYYLHFLIRLIAYLCSFFIIIENEEILSIL